MIFRPVIGFVTASFLFFSVSSSANGINCKYIFEPEGSTILDPAEDSPGFVFNAKHGLTATYIDQLRSSFGKKNSVNIIVNDVAIPPHEINPDLPPDFFSPLLAYMKLLVDDLNGRLPMPERGRMKLSGLRLGISNGGVGSKQVGDNWHTDNFGYLTLLINLWGNGAKYDIAPPLNLRVNNEPAKRYAELRPSEGILMSTLLRSFLFSGPGATPLRHRAPFGPRLGLIAVFEPEGLNSIPDANITVQNLISNPSHTVEDEENLRKYLLETIFK